MLRVSYIPGTGTGRQGSAPYPAYERPHPQNNTCAPQIGFGLLRLLAEKPVSFAVDMAKQQDIVTPE